MAREDETGSWKNDPELAARVEEQARILRRGTAEILPEEGLEEKIAQALRAGRPLRVKAGFDPTAPHIHLGHTVLLQKLAQFQRLGHRVLFLVGDFTARIGDPTGRNEMRKPLTPEEIAANAATYTEQAFKVLDPERTEVVYNSRWLEELEGADWLRLAAAMTVARMLEREDFAQRFRNGVPIGIHEFLYPLLQDRKSVV